MVERKYYAHYVDASFGAETPIWVLLGKDLEEYNEELNPDVETSKNILGEQSVKHSGYEVSSEVEPLYYEYGDALTEKVAEIANKRLTGDKCKTKKTDVLFKEDGTVLWAYEEDVYIVPNSIGGDTTGVQIPISIYNAGNRKEVTKSWELKPSNITNAAQE